MAVETGNPGGYAREVRDTIVKSSLTGVAATVLAVTIFSPAGFGGMIGTSLASGLGLDTKTSASGDAYGNLPAYPAPLSATELNQIRGELARTTASLEITRAATEAKIENLRSLAGGHDVVTFTPAPQAQIGATPIATVVPVSAPTAETIEAANSGGGADLTVPHRDPNMELAALLFAHENY
jgi:hypothetical protein